MPSRPLLAPNLINESLAQSCLSSYGEVLQTVYAETRPKLKLDDIIADDVWRYEELPKASKTTQSLAKEQLAKLVKWKM